jgi:drug/metabolite transporter (DMT)-like permease
MEEAKRKVERKKLVADGMLLLTAMIWGAAFVAQSAGMAYVGPFTLGGIRMTLGAAVLLLAMPLLDKLRGVTNGWRTGGHSLWLGGALCGLALFAAGSLQQIALQYTTAGKAGFLTALYVVLVPVFRLVTGKRPGWRLWVSVALAAAGLYLLCVHGSLALSFGDGLLLLSAVGFTFHILIIDRFVHKVDGVRMSCIQFFVAGTLSLCCMFLLETPTWAGIQGAAIPILYTGILSCGVAYTLQIVGQKNTDPTVASLILCLESVFSVLFGWLLLHEQLSAREGAGCILMFAAIILAQFT